MVAASVFVVDTAGDGIRIKGDDMAIGGGGQMLEQECSSVEAEALGAKVMAAAGDVARQDAISGLRWRRRGGGTAGRLCSLLYRIAAGPDRGRLPRSGRHRQNAPSSASSATAAGSRWRSDGNTGWSRVPSAER